jgi:predicted SnoaL-like aldol condensation-catalyzing enzyme
MSKLFIFAAGLATAVLACSGGENRTAATPPASEDDAPAGTGSPAVMGSAQGMAAQPGSPEQTIAPVLPATGGSAGMMPAPADGALQPALPVVENPDHEQLLGSAVPELASNKRRVYDMWRTLIEARDTQAAQQYFAESYIQHNPNADTGRAGVLAYFSSLGAPLPVQDRVQAKLVAIVAEGSFVAVARVDERDQPRAYTTTWFDLFRFEGGLIAEHWDPAVLPAGGSPRSYVPPVQNPDQESSLASSDVQLASNKRLVYDMWRTLLDAQQVEQAPQFLADGYIQHNPQANTGLQGFLAFFRQFAQPKAVQPSVANFIQMIAEGDLVVLATVRSYTNAAAPYTSTWFDMFRVSDAKLVEHWDTGTLPVQ